MTRRRWIADEVSGDRAVLLGEHADHLARVLRARIGQEFDIATGAAVCRGRITSVTNNRVEFELGEEVSGAGLSEIILVLAIFKFDRMEWAIEKATELGAERIVPVIARRSEKHLAQAAASRAERWRRVALEASKQARRSDVLQIEKPVALKVAVKDHPEAVRLVLAEQERSTTLHHALQEALDAAGDETPAIRMAAGPEGGWTAEEEALFDSENWKPVSLGPRILRAETAAITAMAVAAALME